MRNMQTKSSLSVAAVLLLVPGILVSGNLEPSGPPSAGTMHTLEDIYNQVSVMGLSGAENSMSLIEGAATEYYRGHRDIPDPDAGTVLFSDASFSLVAGTVPSAVLGIDPALEYDTWGNPHEYHLAKYLIPGEPPPVYMANIRGVTVDGYEAAGVIISFGPNGNPEFTAPTSINDLAYTTAGDDILIPITVTAEALSFARQDLAILQERARAFDRLYVGVDNNGDGLADCVDGDTDGTCDPGEEGVCEHQTPVGDSPGSCPATGADNDPNCGTATLDYYEDFGILPPKYNCPGDAYSAGSFIIKKYSLPERLVVDPWGGPYLWGYDGGEASPAGTTITPATRWYHTFFSAGPDFENEDDDIFP